MLKKELRDLLINTVEEVTDVISKQFDALEAERDMYMQELATIACEYEETGELSEETKNVLSYVLLTLKCRNEEKEVGS